MARVSRGRLGAVQGGIFAGLIGGVVLSILMLLLNLAAGQDVWPGFKGAAAPLLGERAFTPGFELAPVLLGLICHFAVSAVWGLLFGLAFYGLSVGATLAAGALWGMLVWLAMYYIVLPLLGLGEISRQVPVPAAVLQHLVFGITVGAAFAPFQRAAALRRRVPVHTY